MRVFMLGWEFPPFIAGGLGTACYGLTRAMARAGHHIDFVLPLPVDGDTASHVTLLTPKTLTDRLAALPPPAPSKPTPAIASQTRQAILAAIDEEQRAAASRDGGEPGVPTSLQTSIAARERMERAVLGSLAQARGQSQDFDASAYPTLGPELVDPAQRTRILDLLEQAEAGDAEATAELGRIGLPLASDPGLSDEPGEVPQLSVQHGNYGNDPIGDAYRYATICAQLARGRDFDVIHAHDWLTYPAGIAVKAITGKPLVCHVHATEFDRSGEHVNNDVYGIERWGMHAADRLIAVSMLTKGICERRYGADGSKIDVVYNGVEHEPGEPGMDNAIEAKDKIVLFLGRITMQKGPEYFIRAAKRVLEKVDDVKFVVAGSGDMAMRMIEHAAELGIGHKVLFTGFLRGADVERVFKMADCFVMPSVSEPFGIAPLEAISHDTPVIISKQSGVAEVLTHALKVDFWDIDEMANKIVAVLRYSPLQRTLREHGTFELKKLTWDRASRKTVESYEAAIAGRSL